MKPEELQKLNELYDFMQSLKNSASISYEVDGALRDRLGDQFVKRTISFDLLSAAPYPAISAPTGGATVDTPARNAINSIRSTLTAAGITL